MSQLLEYVHKILEPTSEQKDFMKSIIKSIDNVLTHNSCLALKEIRHGGSFEKDTMLKYRPDIDIVFVFNKKQDIESGFQALRVEVYKNLKAAFPKQLVEEGENIAIHVKFDNEEHQINVDVVPSYSVNSPLQASEVKDEKIYQGIATIWHIEYINLYKNKPYFMDVVRLLKDWNNKNDIHLKSFYLELIAAFTYGRYNKKIEDIDFILNLCFRKIQAMTDGKPIIPVNWRYFKKISYKRHYQKPFMIDPANPKNNVFENLPLDDRKKIKSYACKAMTFISQKVYGKVFTPQNETTFFT
jgi:tRNA nucleotidyltransferase (CCA-adding enzyme)